MSVTIVLAVFGAVAGVALVVVGAWANQRRLREPDVLDDGLARPEASGGAPKPGSTAYTPGRPRSSFAAGTALPAGRGSGPSRPGASVALLIAGVALLGGAAFLVTLHFAGEGGRAEQAQEKPSDVQERVAQLRNKVSKIDDDIREAINREVRQEVELRATQKSLNDLRKEQDAREERLKAMTAALKTQDARVTFEGQDYKREELSRRLLDLTTVVDQQKEAINRTELQLKAQQERLNAIGKDVLELQDEKAKLTALIADLERRLEQGRRRGAEVDQERLQEIERALADIELRFEDARKAGAVKELVKPDAGLDGANLREAVKDAEKRLEK
jgi:peptidoglycan hydrolase CwlO-like protein